MFGLVTVVALGALAVFYRKPIEDAAGDLPAKLADKLDKLWEVAQESLSTKKYLRAEKALLTILRVDDRNATAYNRLGILYAKQKAYKDAIDCFEIAQSLEPSAASLHNVGLIYYETENYTKAALAFEQAIDMESGVASRHIAYAKVQEKLGHNKKMIEALEKAVEIDPNPSTLKILADSYEKVGQDKLAADLRDKAKQLIAPQATQARQKPLQKRRIV